MSEHNHHERRYIPCLPTCEDVENYEVGGFHPVTIDDTFHGHRYRVVHKLGSGGRATVWLAQDMEQNRMVAMKILSADSSTDSDELEVYQHLSKSEQTETRTMAFAAPLDHFKIHGPNGKHLCLVLPFPWSQHLEPASIQRHAKDETRSLAQASTASGSDSCVNT